MSVNDLSDRVRPRTPRVRWLMLAFTSFTLGAAAATTLFAYSSRIPIPLKDNPTASDSQQISLRSQQHQPAAEPVEPEMRFRETLRRRNEGVLPEAQAEPVSPPAAAEPAAEDVPSEDLSYYVIAGTFDNETLAGERLSLVESGLEDSPASVQVRSEAGATDDQSIHKVLIGPFVEKKDADGVRGRLAMLGLKGKIERLPDPAAAAAEPPVRSQPPAVQQQVAQ